MRVVTAVIFWKGIVNGCQNEVLLTESDKAERRLE